MTKEEALKVLVKMRAWREWGKEQKEEERPEMPEQKEVDEAFDVCIKLLQPSLPSNLDEAAEKYSQTKNPYGKNAFKAGAEWMAGQGVTKEITIGMATEKIIISVSEQTLNGLDPYPGDKVVVQIRKK